MNVPDILTNIPKKSLKILFIFYVLSAFAIPAIALNPYAKSNNSWITISGTISTVSPDAFKLDFGDEEILVEMDDGDRDSDGYKLLPGDKVTVTGKIDDDLFEKTSIEASSVFVEKLGTTFFASEIDEEDFPIAFATFDIIAPITIYGPVTSVNDNEFTLGRDKSKLKVDVSAMANNPLDPEGYQNINVGDYVQVKGTMVKDSQKGRKLICTAVTELFD